MPGMMDTVLNLGLNDATVEGLADAAGDARFAYDSYRRFIQMYARRRARRRPRACSRTMLDEHKERKGVTLDTDLTADDWQGARRALQGASSRSELGKPFPQDPQEQLWGAIGAVFGSLDERRAPSPIAGCTTSPTSWGTAVNVQAMVFGNMGDDCATGVAFTRNPSTGENELLRRVPDQRAGRGRRRRHPHAAGHHRGGAQRGGLRHAVDGRGDAGGLSPSSCAICDMLEKHYRDMQDIEFTVQQRQALDAADAHRQAHRPGGAEDRRRHGRARA